MVTVALYSLKGGVGKTSASINLAYLSALEGYQTLIWDLDPQGSSSFFLGVEAAIKNESKRLLNNELALLDAVQQSPYQNLSIIPADLSARQADILLSDMKQSKKKVTSLLSSIKKIFDVVIIDCPPGISLLHDNVFNAVDWVLMPNIPTTLSIRSYTTVVNYFEEHGFDTEKIKCFFSMVDHRKNLHHEVINQFYKDTVFLRSYIPYLSDIEKMGINEAPLETFAANSFAAQCYKDLWKEIKKTSFE